MSVQVIKQYIDYCGNCGAQYPALTSKSTLVPKIRRDVQIQKQIDCQYNPVDRKKQFQQVNLEAVIDQPKIENKGKQLKFNVYLGIGVIV